MNHFRTKYNFRKTLPKGNQHVSESIGLDVIKSEFKKDFDIELETICKRLNETEIIISRFQIIENEISVIEIINFFENFNWSFNVTNFTANRLDEDFGMGVSAPVGLDQGVPYSGDGSGVYAKPMGLYTRTYGDIAKSMKRYLRKFNKKKRKRAIGLKKEK